MPNRRCDTITGAAKALRAAFAAADVNALIKKEEQRRARQAAGKLVRYASDQITK
ncbi:hypothetical protein [Bradyrhizobium sp. USDA 4451]